MNARTLCSLLALVAQTTTSANATADVPACPASLGSYVATVDGSAVTVCATSTPRAGVLTPGCPYTTGMVRVDVSTGATKKFLGPCVPDPATGDADDAGDASDAGTPCFLDPCVPAGTYEYGYQIPAFGGCDESCAGPTSGQWATVVTVSSTACGQDAGAAGSPGLSLATWRDIDAAVVDGAVSWSGTCTGPLPGPDGGYCAWEWLDGSAQWAPCPAEGGTLCAGYTADGSAVPVECPNEEGGFGGALGLNGNGGSGSSAGTSPIDAGAAATAMTSAAAATGGQTSNRGGGCSVSHGPGGSSYAILVALPLAFGVRRARRNSLIARKLRARRRHDVVRKRWEALQLVSGTSCPSRSRTRGRGTDTRRPPVTSSPGA